MENLPLVSIIIPVYNVETYIEKCMLSVLNQTYSHIEAIIVDDCTPDNSIEIAQKVITRYSGKNVRILKHATNSGLSAARNTGIKEATGDYIYFLDSDDEITIDAIEVLVSLLKNKRLDFVLGGVKQVYPNFVDYILPKSIKNRILESNKSIRDSFFEGKWNLMAWNKLVKKDFILENDLFFEEGIYHEDNLWSFQLAIFANSMGLTDAVTYIYYINQGSISTSIKQKNIDDLVFVLSLIIDLSKKYNIIKDVLCLEYIERNRFYVLSLPSTKNSWVKHFMAIRKISYCSTYNILKITSFGIKIRRLMQIYPPIINYYIFSIITRLKEYNSRLK